MTDWPYGPTTLVTICTGGCGLLFVLSDFKEKIPEHDCKPRGEGRMMAYGYASILGLTMGLLCFEQEQQPNEHRQWLIERIRETLKTGGGRVQVQR